MNSHLIDPQSFGKVAVLMGGWSAEREVSLKSGAAVLKALQSRGVDAHGIDVQRDTVLSELQKGNYNIAFNILHGPGGEDGVMQGALEVLGLAYTGSKVLASSLSMDKLRSKQLLEAIGLPTPNYMVLEEDTDFEYVAATLGLPMMVKPAREGSSIGMSKVEDASQLHSAWQLAAQFSGAVLAEQWISGSEYTVAILGDEALPAIKLETDNTFYDYEAKYQSDDTRYICPCGLDEHAEAQMKRMALACFNALGAEGWGRVDIFLDEQQRPWILELNTLPGMTDHSLVPMAAKAAGIEFDELVIRILQQAIDKGEQ
ncbi:MAG: D-alanine--D-alanine ligase [Gammaproteobacteria bacterium]|nr:D-alanine--D-alanine ligase [Gammaproteobacteria bacterium]